MSAAFTRLVEQLDAADVTVSPGWGRENQVAKRDGRMFLLWVDGQLVAKLPRARVAALVEAGDGALFNPKKTGAGMKEWLVVSCAQKRWLSLAREAMAFTDQRQGRAGRG